MRNIVVYSSDLRSGADVKTFTLDQVAIPCGVLETPDTSPELGPHSVLVQVKAFSCNYRDLALMARQVSSGKPRSYALIGSEFAGEVMAVGPKVTTCREGDRVMADCSYRGYSWEEPQGIPTNAASREIQVIDGRQLQVIPAAMSYAEAAAFSIGAQTAYSMIRRLKVKAEDRILVLSARANTSLFAIAALKARGAQVFAATTSTRFRERLLGMGACEVVAEPWPVSDGVIDPFFDLHLPEAVKALRPNGRYASCGVWNQYQAALTGTAPPTRGEEIAAALAWSIGNNLNVILNCLGSKEDLLRALADYEAGHIRPVLDSVYRGGKVGSFLDRTFVSADRFGKVVYSYESP